MAPTSSDPRNVEGSAALIHWSAASFKRAVAGMLVGREDKDCHPSPNINLCEKPGISTSTITWIVVGCVVGTVLVGTLSVLTFFHIRKTKRDKREDMSDRFQMSDYGLDDMPSRKSRRNEEPKLSPEGSPNGYGRRSREPLNAPGEPTYQGGRLNGHLNPFDDKSSVMGSSNPPSVAQQWPKRDSSHQSPPGR